MSNVEVVEVEAGLGETRISNREMSNVEVGDGGVRRGRRRSGEGEEGRSGGGAVRIGVIGFEPTASWSQTRRSNQAELHPVV